MRKNKGREALAIAGTKHTALERAAKGLPGPLPFGMLRALDTDGYIPTPGFDPYEWMNRVFAADCVTPGQWREGVDKAHWRGERRLVFAVLEDAVEVFFKGAFSRDPKYRALALAAEVWFADPEEWGWGSAESVCAVCGLQRVAVWEALQRWRGVQGALRARGRGRVAA